MACVFFFLRFPREMSVVVVTSFLWVSFMEPCTSYSRLLCKGETSQSRKRWTDSWLIEVALHLCKFSFIEWDLVEQKAPEIPQDIRDASNWQKSREWVEMKSLRNPLKNILKQCIFIYRANNWPNPSYISSDNHAVRFMMWQYKWQCLFLKYFYLV